MPSCTRTPEQSRLTLIQQVAHRADTLAVLLAAVEFMSPAEVDGTLAICLPLAHEVAASLAKLGGAA